MGTLYGLMSDLAGLEGQARQNCLFPGDDSFAKGQFFNLLPQKLHIISHKRMSRVPSFSEVYVGIQAR